MENLLSDGEGKLLLKIARENIEAYMDNREYEVDFEIPEIFKQKRGVFVTLNKNNNLRGCIGYPEPYKPLIDALLDVSISAAVNDPRFRPVTKDELRDIDIEISVLTKPELIDVEDPQEYFDKITIGEDGLILENAFNRGLLLPQVPVEQGWDVNEFLVNLAYKAGTNFNAWQEMSTKIYKFQAQIFDE